MVLGGNEIDSDASLSLNFNSTQDINMAVGGGSVGINVVPSGTSKLHVKQGGSAAAIPALMLEQADISEGYIDFIGNVVSISGDAAENAVLMEVNGDVKKFHYYPNT
jgi:hypothetical protein